MNPFDCMLKLVGKNNKVLDLTGISTFVASLNESHCTVKSINDISHEINTKQFEITNNFEETLNIVTSKHEEKFDAIVIGDLLGKLLQPKQLLNNLHNLLNPDGRIIAYVPNISHISVRIKLLNGDFIYSDGVINEKYVRFFTLDNILLFLDDCKYYMNNLIRLTKNISLENQDDLKYFTIPQELLESILLDPEATAEYYIFSAYPVTQTNSVRRHLLEFSKDIPSENLKKILDNYKNNASQYSSVKNVEDYDNKIDYLHQELDKSNKRIMELENLINEIHESITWKILRRWDSIRQKKSN